MIYSPGSILLTLSGQSRRPFRLAVIVVCVFLLAATGLDIYRQVRALTAARQQLSEALNLQPVKAGSGSADPCVEEAPIGRLLITASGIDARFGPSFVGNHFWRSHDEQADFVVNKVLEDVVFPSFRCLIERQAVEFVARTQAIGVAPDSRLTKEGFFSLLGAAKSLWIAADNYRKIAAPGGTDNSEQVASNLKLLGDLYEYAYQAELPDEVSRSGTRLGLSLARIDFNPRISLPGEQTGRTRQPQAIETMIGAKLVALSRRFNSWLLARVASGGALDIARSGSGESPALSLSEAVDWADWVSATWLGRSEFDNVCLDYRARFKLEVDEMQAADFSFDLADAEEQFSNPACYAPALAALRNASWPGAGLLFDIGEGDVERFSALARQAIAGIRGARQMSYVDVPVDGTPVCLVQSDGWDEGRLLLLVGYVHEFAAFAEGLPSDRSSPGEQAVNAFVLDTARARLRDVAAFLIFDAQIPALPAAARLGDQRDSQIERVLLNSSIRFARLAPLLTRLQESLAEQGLGSVRRDLSRCVGSYVHDQLAHVSNLARIGRVYRLDVRQGEELTGGAAPLFSLNSPPEAESYVLTQTERSGVLTGYAGPFVRYTNVHRPDFVNASGLLRTWESTVLDFAQFHRSNAAVTQIGLLNDFIVNLLQGLTTDNCQEALRDYYPEAFGDDFFSRRRNDLHKLAKLRCARATGTVTNEQLNGVAEEFAIALANRSNLASEDVMQPIRVIATFRPNARNLDGTEQVYQWRMGSPASAAARAHSEGLFEWLVGEPVEFSVTWASQSAYVPQNDRPGEMPLIGGPENRTATFRISDPWALLTMIDIYSAPMAGENVCEAVPVKKENALMLCFPISVTGRKGTNVAAKVVPFYVQLDLFGMDGATAEWKPLRYPVDLPLGLQ